VVHGCHQRQDSPFWALGGNGLGTSRGCRTGLDRECKAGRGCAQLLDTRRYPHEWIKCAQSSELDASSSLGWDVQNQQARRGYLRAHSPTRSRSALDALHQNGPRVGSAVRQPALEVRFHDDNEIHAIGR
jgi:hypothetical protein